MRCTTALWAIAAGFLMPATTQAGSSFRHLTGPEITARFSGMEFTDEVHWGLIFAPGGRLTSRQTGGRMTAVEGEPSHGRWHVSTDELCFGLGSETPRCHQVWASGRDVQLRRDREPPQDGVLRKPGRLSGTGSGRCPRNCATPCCWRKAASTPTRRLQPC